MIARFNPETVEAESGVDVPAEMLLDPAAGQFVRFEDFLAYRITRDAALSIAVDSLRAEWHPSAREKLASYLEELLKDVGP